MSEVVVDTNILNQLVSDIERIKKLTRVELEDIVNRNKSIESYTKLVNDNNLPRTYGEAVDDYGKICYMQTGVSEAILDLKEVRKSMLELDNTIPATIKKQYKYRIDRLIEELTLFRDAVQSSRAGLEAKVRFYSSCAYTSHGTIEGVKA